MQISPLIKGEIKRRLYKIGLKKKQVEDVLQTLQAVMIDHHVQNNYQQIKLDSFEFIISKTLTKAIISALIKLLHTGFTLLGVITFFQFFN